LATAVAVFGIRFRARDVFGNVAPVPTRCGAQHPRAPPLDIAAAAAAVAADGALSPLQALTLGIDGIAANNPDDDDAAIVELIQTAAGGRAIMKVVMKNGTPEPAYLTLAVNPPSGASYERDYLTTNAHLADYSVNRTCGCTSNGANCNPSSPPPSTGVNGTALNATSLNLVIRVFDTTGSAVEITPSAGRYRFEPRAGATSPRIYTVVIATRGLPQLATGMGTVSAPQLTWSGGSRRITGSLGSTFRRCTATTTVPDPDLCTGIGNLRLVCTQEAEYRTFTAMTKARVEFLNETLKVNVEVAATAALTLYQPPNKPAALPAIYTWSTAETGLPPCWPAASGCPPPP
jgi:hypothetical protein